MLGRLEMTVDQCIKSYIALSDRIFRKRYMFAVNWRGKIQPRFDTAALQQIIQDIIKESEVIRTEGTGVNALMRQETPCGCKT